MRRHLSGMGCGPPRARLVTSHSGGPGPRSGATKGRSARSSLDGLAQCQFPETRPGADGGSLT
jgi:hypothetical protein